jgi:hypothetical protein
LKSHLTERNPLVLPLLLVRAPYKKVWFLFGFEEGIFHNVWRTFSKKTLKKG